METQTNVFVVFTSDGVGYAKIEGIFNDLVLAKSQLKTCIEQTNKVIRSIGKSGTINRPYKSSALSEHDIENNVIVEYANPAFRTQIIKMPLNQLNESVLAWYACYLE